jgi:hypothetical protein
MSSIAAAALVTLSAIWCRWTGVAVRGGEQVLAAAAAQHERGDEDDDDDRDDEKHSFGSLG